MKDYSFIDSGLKDFLRDDDGEVIHVHCKLFCEAEDWLLENGEIHGWTNEGVRFWDWEKGENDD